MILRQIYRFAATIVVICFILSCFFNIAAAQDSSAQGDTALNQKFEELKSSLNTAQSNLNKSMIDTSLIERRLSEVSEEITTLADQIQELDKSREKTESRIVVITKEIQKNSKESNLIGDQVKALEKEIATQEDSLSSLLRFLYIESSEAGFFDSDELQTVKLLLNEENANEILERADSLSILDHTLKDLILSLRGNKKKLSDDKAELDALIAEQEKLKKDLQSEKVLLSLQIESKSKLLDSTKGEESVYQNLLSQSKSEQISIRREIIDLSGQYAEVKKQLGKDGFAIDDFTAVLNPDKLSWPVPPTLGISAYFRDRTYKAALGVEHNAIDIRAPMASQISAPADGVVLKVKGGEGTDYHYIIVAHNDGIMTLYGHMYDIFVKEGEKVARGQVLGLTGGLPGARGSGWLTTGPHLHFEVFLNGVHKDPLDFLDLSQLPAKWLP